jgi:hypothetical protein
MQPCVHGPSPMERELDKGRNDKDSDKNGRLFVVDNRLQDCIVRKAYIYITLHRYRMGILL